MDEQLLQDLFDLTTEGAFSSFEEFKSFIETDGENAFNDIYELTIDGAFASQDEYNTFVNPLKKKRLFSINCYFSSGKYGIAFTYRNNPCFIGITWRS